jgi:CAAX prenyl protease-like protein
VLPFATLIVLLGIGGYLPPAWSYPIRMLIVTGVLLAVSRGVISLRASHPLWSALFGAAVFAVWIGPDLLWPGYRQHWLFSNPLTAGGANSVEPGLRGNAVFLLFRAGGSILVVPVVEELFWRAWLMRRLISPEFDKVPLGTYDRRAFWITAALFALEHGVYWDVGLAAGAAYNWWMVRTRSVADCIVAHAVTNACLAAYVVGTGAWQYW